MMVIGLTGGIGMGKSTVAKILCDFGFTVFSADEVVRNLYATNSALIGLVGENFPETKIDGGINTVILDRIVFEDPIKLDRLEKIVHPFVREAEIAFLEKERRKNTPVVILEIPLLFETEAEKRCNVTLCVSAPPDAQRARVLPRPRMTETKFRTILARQLPDAEKCARADYMVPTGTSLDETKEFLRVLFTKIGLLDEKTQPCVNAAGTSGLRHALTKKAP